MTNTKAKKQSDEKMYWFETFSSKAIKITGSIAGIRVLGKQSSFDILTSLMLGSIMVRAIVAGQNFFGSILAALVIMLLHRFSVWITFRSKKAGTIIKGREIFLMKDGKLQSKNLSKALITEHDILEALRHDANITPLKSSHVGENISKCIGKVFQYILKI